MLLTPEEVMDAQHYNEDELETIRILIMGAEAFLKNAGAFHADNDLTKVAVLLIVGNWLQNREQDYTDYKEVRDFPLGIRSIISQLQHLPESGV